jgi:hypothetical protein
MDCVSTHMRRTFAKLAVSTRAPMAARLLETRNIDARRRGRSYE